MKWLWLILVMVLVAPCLQAADAPTTWVAPDAAAAAADDGMVAAAATEGFKASLNKAATKAFREGKISRTDLAKIRLTIMLRPRVTAELQATVLAEFEAAAASGAIPAGEMPAMGAGAPDWVAIFELIMKYLPQIIELILSLI